MQWRFMPGSGGAESFNGLTGMILQVADMISCASSSGNYMKLLHSDTPYHDYGALKSFLDNNRYKSSSLKRTINPKGSGTFYVVTLSNRGIGGTIRAGLSLKEQNLFYRINDKEIHCGKINLKNLRL